MVILAVFAALGFIVNIFVYIDDIRNRGSMLNKVHTDDNLEALMTSPTGERKVDEGQASQFVDSGNLYLTQGYSDGNARDALKRSIARSSMAK